MVDRIHYHSDRNLNKHLSTSCQSIKQNYKWLLQYYYIWISMEPG